MLLSFFSSWYITDNDQSHNPDCIYQEDIVFDPTTQTVELIETEWVYSIRVSDIPRDPESPSEKKARVIEAIISAEDISTLDTEGVTFTKKEKWEIISRKLYEGNIYDEIAEVKKKVELLDKPASKHTIKDKEDFSKITLNETKRNQILSLLK